MIATGRGMVRCLSRPAAVVAATALLALAAATAHAGSSPNENEHLCSEIAQHYQTVRKPADQREIDFLLFDAAERGCDALVEMFLEAGALVATRDRSGNTALSVAAKMGQATTVELLVAAGADVNHRNILGVSPLLHAVTDGRRQAAKALLALGADPNLGNAKGVTPVITAAFNGEAKMLDMLLEAGADPLVNEATGKGPMVYAAGRGYLRIVQRLLKVGIDPARTYGNDLTALMWAAGHSNDVPEAEGLATVEALLEAGAPVGPADNRGRTALMIAAGRGHAAIAARLIAAGADPAARDKDGKAAADLAADDAVRAALTALQ